jgi:hypothetical protein
MVSAFQLHALALNDLAATDTLSLADAKRQAFQCNWDLLAAQSGVDVATAQSDFQPHGFPDLLGAMPFATNLNMMIFFRACQGITGGALIPLAFNVILTLLTPTKQPIGMVDLGRDRDIRNFRRPNDCWLADR